MKKENTLKPNVKSFRITPVLEDKIDRCREAIIKRRHLSYSEYTFTDFLNEAIDFYTNFVIDDTINGLTNLSVLEVIIDRKMEQHNRLTLETLNMMMNKLSQQDEMIHQISKKIDEI